MPPARRHGQARQLGATATRDGRRSHRPGETGRQPGLRPGAPIENDKEALKAVRNLQEQARPLTAWWLKQRTSDVRPLRLSRTLLWLSIDSLPEHNGEQVTALRGIPADKLANYRERFAQGLYADLLVDLENSTARARSGWTVSAWPGSACRSWRPNKPCARWRFSSRCSCSACRVWRSCASDGTPFADAETRAWISGQVLPHVQPAATTRQEEPPASGSIQPSWELALQEALPLLRKEGLKPAVQQLKQGLARARGGRERFFWQLSLARLCYQAKIRAGQNPARSTRPAARGQRPGQLGTRSRPRGTAPAAQLLRAVAAEPRRA